MGYFVDLYFQSKEIEDIKPSSSVESITSTVPYVETPVNFEELKAMNPDIYAWINIPGTKVDYPILNREGDDAYYLNHTVAGKKSVYGSIYTEEYNGKEFADFNTLIYGHNMRNATMFGSLRSYRNKAFFDENCYINIYMPGRIMKYQIFAAYVYDNRHILVNFNFNDEAVREEYLNEIFSNNKMTANINNQLQVTKDDKIITLSTCTNNDDERYLVQGVLIYDSREQG